MTQNHTNEDSVPGKVSPTNAEILQKWYEFSSRQPGTIGSLLQLLRFRQRKSEEQQQLEFDTSPINFAKLQSMRAPRPDRFQYDAHRIAVACHVGQVFHFVQMLMLARNLAANEQTDIGEAYEAAFDASAIGQDFMEE